MAEGLCKCGELARPGQRTCCDCHARYMRRWRARCRDQCVERAAITPEIREQLGDIATRNQAIERIRNTLDRELADDPLGVRRYTLALYSEPLSRPNPGRKST